MNLILFNFNHPKDWSLPMYINRAPSHQYRPAETSRETDSSQPRKNAWKGLSWRPWLSLDWRRLISLTQTGCLMLPTATLGSFLLLENILKQWPKVTIAWLCLWFLIFWKRGKTMSICLMTQRQLMDFTRCACEVSARCEVLEAELHSCTRCSGCSTTSISLLQTYCVPVWA